MRIWQVQVVGDGFIRGGMKSAFEMCCIVEAPNANSAFAVAVKIAKLQYPELEQAGHPPGSSAVINAEEIQEYPNAPTHEIGKIELYWDNDSVA